MTKYKKSDRMFDELWDGYQAIAEVFVTDDEFETGGYAEGYVDGWCDAMGHGDLAAGKNPVVKRFPLCKDKRLRKLARKVWRENDDRGDSVRPARERGEDWAR